MCEQCWPRSQAGDAPVCHQPSLLDQGRYRLLRGGQEQLPLVKLFCAFISLLLAVSCHWLPAMALSPSPVPSLHAQPVPTSLPAAGPTLPPQLAAAPYCGNYYLLWIFSVHYVHWSPVQSESLPGSRCVGRSTQSYRVVSRWYSLDSHTGKDWGERGEGGCWHLLALSDVTPTLCAVLRDSSDSTAERRAPFSPPCYQ